MKKLLFILMISSLFGDNIRYKESLFIEKTKLNVKFLGVSNKKVYFKDVDNNIDFVACRTVKEIIDSDGNEIVFDCKRKTYNIKNYPQTNQKPDNIKDGINIPEKVGNVAIDNFIDTAYDLHNKLTNLKDTLANVSDDLNKANKVLNEIENHPNGVLGWGYNQLVIIYYDALKGPDINIDFNNEIKNILEVFNNSDGEFLEVLLYALQTGLSSNKFSNLTIEDLIKLNIKYDPTKFVREKLGLIKNGLLNSKQNLESIPDDIKNISEQASDLIQLSTKLISEARGLGIKAPKAIKAIKNTASLIKNIPNDVSDISNESIQAIEEVKNVTDSIQGILGSFK